MTGCNYIVFFYFVWVPSSYDIKISKAGVIYITPAFYFHERYENMTAANPSKYPITGRKAAIKNPYILYSLSFILLLPVIFQPFLAEGKSLVWKTDGLSQHYPVLMYYGELLRGLLSGDGFPMVDFRLGLGFDTITTIHYYALGDPLDLLAVFMAGKASVFLYNLLILLRFYLAGISYILLMKYWKQQGTGIAAGALIYTFCGYAFFAGVRHPFFLNPMIYLPLLILGAEKVFRREKPYLLIIMTMISAISNFYFFYVLSVILVAYIIIRYFTLYRKSCKNILTGFLMTGLRTGGCYLLGVTMASGILLPVLYAFSQNGRLNMSPEALTGFFHYSRRYYLTFLQSFFAPGISPGYWTQLSFCAVIIVSLAIMILNRSYHRLLPYYLLISAGLFIPGFGYFMNGFSYIANRWGFLFSLLIAYTFTLTYDRILHLKRKEQGFIILEVILYGITVLGFTSERSAKYTFYILLFLALVILLLQTGWFRARRTVGSIILYILVLSSLGFNGYAFYSGHFTDYVSEFLSSSQVDSMSSKGVLTLVSDLSDDSFYRVEIYGDKAQNEAIISDYHDVTAYYSLMDGKVTSYLSQLELHSQKAAIRFDNMNSRTILDALACVKYFVTTNKAAVPYGYRLLRETGTGDESYYLFENEYALPLGYTYDSYMLAGDYDKLSALEKQNALMEAVILEAPTDYARRSSYNPKEGIEELEKHISPEDKIRLTEDTIAIKKKDSDIMIEFEAQPNCETYLRLRNFNIKGTLDTAASFSVKGSPGTKKTVVVRSPYNTFYFGKENHLINLGYSEEGISSAKLTFQTRVKFRYEDIEVYSVSMSNYAAQAERLREYSLQNVVRKNNYIRGDVELDTRGVLVLSIPYSKGWSATVDGAEAQLLNANLLNMGLQLEPGSHHIELKYETPYLRIGFLVSCAAFLVFFTLVFILRHRKPVLNS